MDHEVIINPGAEVDDMNEKNESVSLPIRTANSIARSYLQNISSEDLYESEAAVKNLTDLIQRVINQDVKSGDADDWHNFAVDIAREDLYDLACDPLECGLKIYPKNIDLLADFLQYGTSCERTEECKAYYKVLSKIPKIRWSWRGYCFSVSYLKYLWERSDSEKELEKLQMDMMSLAESFRINLPFDEECYRCEADIYKLLHKKQDEERVLRSALKELKIAPKCALRLADMLFERGDYEESLVHIQRGLRDAMQTQQSVNEGYLYYLMGLTKIALIEQKCSDMTPEVVDEIYSCFDISLRQERRNSYVSTMKAKTIVLVNKSGIQVPDKYEEERFIGGA